MPYFSEWVGGVGVWLGWGEGGGLEKGGRNHSFFECETNTCTCTPFPRKRFPIGQEFYFFEPIDNTVYFNMI